MSGCVSVITRRQRKQQPRFKKGKSRRGVREERREEKQRKMGIRPLFRVAKEQSTQLFRFITQVDIR